MDRLSEVRAYERQRFCEIWQALQAGESLTGEEGRIGRILEEHPEYREAWDRDEPPGESEYTIGGVNPFLHVSSHVAVENQLALGHPPDVVEAKERMERNGTPPHEAIHRIGAILMEEIRRALLAKRPINLHRYRRKIRKLA
jgi:hypothetical protein